MSNNEFGDSTDNPYQAIGRAPLVPVSSKPTSLTVFGIINIVYGVMGVCGVAAMSIQMALVDAQPQMDNPMIDLTNSPIYRGYTIVQLILNVLFTILLLVSGFGLLAGKPYGRTLSIVWSICSLIMGVIGIVFVTMFLIVPLMERANAMDEGPEKMALMFGSIGAGVGGLCGMIYPVVLLIFMMRAPVVNYMRVQQNS